MLPSIPEISATAIDISWLVKILIYLILVGFLVFSLFLWRQVILASRVLDTKATPIVRFMAAAHFIVVISMSVIIALFLL